MPASSHGNRIYHEFLTENIQPLWFDNWQIKNFKKDSYRIIYPGSPLRVSYYKGPSTAHMSISDSVSNTFSASSGISVKMVEAKVGYSLSETRTITDSIDINVQAGKTLQIKAYALYDQWRMDVYKNGSYVSEEYFHRTVGVSFEQYIFSSN